MKTLRYILILPVTILWCLGAGLLTLKLEGYRVFLFCPTELREVADCYAPDWVSYPIWLICFGVSLSAIFVVAIPAIIAPKNKYKISLCAFVIGCFCATILGITTELYIPLICCLIIATITFYIVVHNSILKTSATFGCANNARPF